MKSEVLRKVSSRVPNAVRLAIFLLPSSLRASGRPNDAQCYLAPEGPRSCERGPPCFIGGEHARERALGRREEYANISAQFRFESFPGWNGPGT